MKTLGEGRERPRLDPDDLGARKRAAVETYARHEAVLRRAAARYSLCAADAEDALQRGLEILLRKAPTDDPRELVKWTQTVVKREALAIRRDRERILGAPAPADGEAEGADWVELLPAGSEGPAEAVERREAVARSREALRTLKPQELRALTLLAEGYSYAEIGEITSWTRTKVNRCIAEGRERFRGLISRSEDGRRCAEMRPLLSAFCDGETNAAEAAELREHLRACGHCRATLRTYRAAPAAAAALLPALPLHRSLLERAHEALAELAGRLGAGRGGAISQAAGGSGAGGMGVAAAAKVAAVCVGAAGGAACVAAGVVPAPPGLGVERLQPVRSAERQVDANAWKTRTPVVEYQPAPAPAPSAGPRRVPDPVGIEAPEPAEAAAPAASEPVAAGAVESAPAPEPEPAPEPAPAPSAAAGSPAGEFGP
ncbi:MAG TPA: sigma-70 family RNA polymerase sigma factor [Solirubrobacterales bacterium]|nr:sigma-70 family RNA polymerase sigma factor [Solirubrobacterales bacterium]